MRAVARGSRAEVGSSISRISGSTASARAMQSRCCWPPERPRAFSSSRSLTSSQSAARLRLRSTISCSSPLRQVAVQARAVGDVVEDGLGERIRLLEDHADAPAQRDHVDARAVDVLAVEEQLPAGAAAGDQVVHAVDGAQQRALAAAARADDGRHLARRECPA